MDLGLERDGGELSGVVDAQTGTSFSCVLACCVAHVFQTGDASKGALTIKWLSNLVTATFDWSWFVMSKTAMRPKRERHY